MPAYNAVRYVREAIASIRAQTYQDFELIIIDDGSTDATAEVCRRAVDGDPRCRLISRPNTGIVGALNDGFAVSRGTDYIARMDADDVSEPDRFARQVGYLDSHNDCVAIGSRVLAIDPDGDVIGPFDKPLDHIAIDSLLLQGQGNALTHPAVVIRREAFELVKGYDPQYAMAEDIDLFLRLGEIGQLANFPDILLRYRLHPDSLNAVQGAAQLRFIESIIRNACRRRGLADPPPPSVQFSTALESRAMWGYAAVAGGRFRTAFKHAIRCVARRPWKLAWWRLVAAAIKGLLKDAAYRRRCTYR